MAYVTDDEAERIAGYRQQQGLASKPAPQPDPFQNFQDTVDFAEPAVYGPFQPPAAPAPSYSLSGPSFDSFNVSNQMGPFEPYDLGLESRGQRAPVLWEPEPEPQYDPRGVAFQASQRSTSNPFLGGLSDFASDFLDVAQQRRGTELGGFGFQGQPGYGAPADPMQQNLEAAETFARGNKFISAVTPLDYDTLEGLPYGLNYVTDALSPLNLATAGAPASTPLLGAMFKGPYAKNLAAEIGIDIGANVLGEQAGGELGASVPLFGEQPAWLRQLEGTLIGGLGAAGAIKGVDAGIPALGRYLDEPIEVAPGEFVRLNPYDAPLSSFAEPPKLAEMPGVSGRVAEPAVSPEDLAFGVRDTAESTGMRALDSASGKPLARMSDDELRAAHTQAGKQLANLEDAHGRMVRDGDPQAVELGSRIAQVEEAWSKLDTELAKRTTPIRTFRDLIDSETGSVNIGMFAEAGPVARKRILDQLADRATREGRPTGGIYDDILPTEKVETGIIRTYEGRTGTAGLELQRDLDNGNRLLQDLRIGRRNGRLVNVERSPEVEELFKALHGEGPVPPRLQQVYDDVKRMIAAESEATLRDNPEFVMKDDYFYRGWRAPTETKAGVGRGQVGAKPGYQKPRVDATFSELLDEGWEPLSWNPYEMAALRRNAGVQFREQKQLVDAFKKTGLAVTVDAATPDGYRVPRIGPAFEGKPFAFIPGAEPLSDAVGARVGYTPRYAVPNKVADQLENIFGRKPDSGAFLSSWAKGNAKLKQFKLLFSLFQQVDFATRQGAAGFAGAVDDLLSGKPLSAVRKAIAIPTDSAKLFTANVSGGRQASLRESILSTKPLFNERPGVSLRSISDAGWSTSDISIINTSIKRALDDIAKGGDVGPVKGALRNVEGEGRLVGAPMRRWKALNEASQKGLFEGVYPQAQVTALKKFIVPRIMRQHPDWTDAQISAASATEVNKMFSTLGNFQQVIKNPVSSEFVKSMVFSTNETESLFKQAASTFIGPNKRLWTEYYLGGFVFLAAVANAVHFAATGEPLPMERYQPIKKDGYGPLPVGYNSQFLSPQIPGLRGRNDTPIDLDLMGQMDTVFRLLDPQGFIEARENVGLRALQSQQSGEDFFGRPLEGPKERIGQLAADLAEPIGASQFRGALDIGPEGEGRLGNVGQALQGTGINLRGETTANLKDRKAAEFRDGATWEQLSPRERMELIARDEGLRKELEARRDEAAASGQEWATNQQRVAKRTQELTDFQLGSDKMLADRVITGGAWRSDNSDRKNELWIRKDEIYNFAGTEPGDDPVLDKYYRWIDQSKGPDGEPNWDQVERKVEALPTSQQKYIEDNTGLLRIDTPQVREFEADKAKIEKSGYFDRSEESWAKVQVGSPEARKYDSYEAWESAQRKKLVDGWVKDYGFTPELASREATKAISKMMEADVMAAFAKQWRDDWAIRNPEAAYLAWKWDYYTPTDDMALWLDQVNR
jgi:hypothetical protein